MSQPQPPKPAKLIVGFFVKEKDLAQDVVRELQDRFGAVDMISPWLPFDFTSYYEKEMGWPLSRRFISFRELIIPDSIADIKLITNELEKTHLDGKKRRINIDPGYLTLERLVLATGKNYTHRIYLRKGIYADLTLVFHDGTFKPLSWTYPDYAEEKVIGLFNGLRHEYLKHLREGAQQ